MNDLKSKFLFKTFINNIEKIDHCWVWRGQLFPNGYGRIEVNKKLCLAHRISYELFKGNIPDKKIVMHICDNRPCVNPDHLLSGTHKQNIRDMYNKGRNVEHNSKKTHCKRGHEFSKDNMYTSYIKETGGTRRSCKICALYRDKQRRKNAKSS